MIYYRKEKQFLGIYKSTRTQPEKKCIGIYDLNKFAWTKEAPFVKQEMAGQRYTSFLKFLVQDEIGDPLFLKNLVSFADFYLSIISKGNEENYIENSIEFDEIRDCCYYCQMIGIDIKNVQKEISKLIVENGIENFKLKVIGTNLFEDICNNLASETFPYLKRDYIQEILGYYNMGRKAMSLSEKSLTSFLRIVYLPEIQQLKEENFTQKEILAYSRIKYFQGAYGLISDSKIKDYLQAVRLLEIDIPTGNFLINYRKIMNEKADHEKELTEKQFKLNQEKFNLNFEDEEFKVIVPLTKKEINYYGNVFHNCLGGYEWNNYLRKGLRLVVIIINKQTNKPCICCDMSINSLKIQQFLKEGNNYLVTKDRELRHFKEKYQNYLYSLIEE